MPKTYQFTCAVRIVESGELIPIEGLITPPVTCETPTQAIQHPDTVSFCEANKCVIYRVVK